MLEKNKDINICILALLGDPEIPAGIPGTGGFNQTVNELLNHYKEDSIQISVITNTSRFSRKQYSLYSSNIKIYRVVFDENWLDDQEQITYNLVSIIEDVKLVLDSFEFKPKIIHSFYWLSGIVTLKLFQKYRIPFIHTVVSLAEDKLSVGVAPHVSKQREYECLFLPEAKYILAITPQEKNTLIQKYGITSSKIIVVGRSINDCFAEAHDKKMELQMIGNTADNMISEATTNWWINGAFLFVGRIVKIKGIKQIVKAWIYTKEKYEMTIPLWLVGGTPLQINEMRKEILIDCPNLIQYEKNSEIIWWGMLDSLSISSLMRKAVALIMHSQFEAGGRVIIEALSAGIPTIVTPYGFGADYVFNGYNGFVTEFNDIKALSSVMYLFVLQPFLSSVLGAASFSFMKKLRMQWDFFNIHTNLYIDLDSIHAQADVQYIPEDLNSFKTRNSVTMFPYFSVDRDEQTISNIIYETIGGNKVSIVSNDKYHATFYVASASEKTYIIKCYFHIMASAFLRAQYKCGYVLSARIQSERTVLSASLNRVLKPVKVDVFNYLCIMDKYNILEGIDFRPLFKLWSEGQPSIKLIDLYYSSKFEQLEQYIISSNNSFENHLFCAETAFLFLINNILFVPTNVVNYIKDRIGKGDAVFGLCYGKGVIGHIVKQNNEAFLLPTYSMYLGELGLDIVQTFLQIERDNWSEWEGIKRRQNIISNNRLDLWLLITIYLEGKESNYSSVLSLLLNL